MAIGCSEGGEVVLVGEARHRIVRLRLEARADKPLLGDEPKDGERISAALRRDFGSPSELMNEPGDEYGLAGAREAGDAEPQA